MIKNEKQVDAMVRLAMDFHLKTGADIDLIKQFITDIGNLTTTFAIEVVKEEVRKSFLSSGQI